MSEPRVEIFRDLEMSYWCWRRVDTEGKVTRSYEGFSNLLDAIKGAKDNNPDLGVTVVS